MKKLIYLKLSSFTLLCATVLSLISIFCFIRISEMFVDDYRYGYLMYMARTIEKTAMEKSLAFINVDSVPTPATLIKDETEPQNKLQKLSIWLVSEKGVVLSSNTPKDLALNWSNADKPTEVYGIESNDNYFFKPKTFVVKLNTTPVSYLVSRNDRSPFQASFLWTQGLLSFAIVTIAVFLAMSITFYYLRKKSNEARKVLGEMESGNLGARFEVRRFDEFGNLLSHFNKMAEKIEQLVKRLHATEATRSNFLQELGHDLRTPLTSLSMAFETLRKHHRKLDSEQALELFEMTEADLSYFRDLLDKLTMIATIEEPHYKSSTEQVDLTSLLSNEIKSRQTTEEKINWEFVQESPEETTVAGDSHLILRLFKNALDNAHRYANSSVTVFLTSHKKHFEVLVLDDGPGLGPDDLKNFGKRREQRVRKEKDPHHFSLGLGSVIMKTIAEVHGGYVDIRNIVSNDGISGACLRVVLQKT